MFDAFGTALEYVYQASLQDDILGYFQGVQSVIIKAFSEKTLRHILQTTK